MNCIGPVTPEDFELLAYADGAAAEAEVAHISACPYCRSRAEELRREQQTWERRLRRAGCPPAQALGEHYLGLLPALKAAAVSQHVKYCRACSSELATLARILRSGKEPQARERAIDFSGPLRAIHATLVSFGAGLSPGQAWPAPRMVRELRGPYLDSTPPLTYNAEEFLVTLEFWPEPGAPTRQIVGLVAGPDDFIGAQVEVGGDDGVRLRAPIDELGSFTLSGVAPGAHSLRVRLPTSGAQVEISAFNVN